MVLIIGPKRFSDIELKRLKRDVAGLEAVLDDIDSKVERLCLRINRKTSEFSERLTSLLYRIGIGDISEPHIRGMPFSEISPGIVVRKIDGLIASSDEGRLCLQGFEFTDEQQSLLDRMADKYQRQIAGFSDSVAVYQREQREAHLELVNKTFAVEPFPQPCVNDKVILYVDEYKCPVLLRMYVDLNEFSSGPIEESNFLCAFSAGKTTLRKFRKESEDERANIYVLRNHSSRVDVYHMVTHAVDALHSRWLKARPEEAFRKHYGDFMESRYLAAVKSVKGAPDFGRRPVFFTTSDDIPDNVMRDFEEMGHGKDDVWN